jgi:hypothetical protein
MHNMCTFSEVPSIIIKNRKKLGVPFLLFHRPFQENRGLGRQPTVFRYTCWEVLNEELIYSTLDLKMKEHQQAQRMRALQHFVSHFEGGGKLVMICHQTQNILLCFRKRNVLYILLG